MDNNILRKVQLVELEIAKEIKRVCELLNINYFLDSGTLLGAIRHKGFIPWDDDMDIGMLRDDYERFVNEAPKLLDEKFSLQTWDNDQYYGLAFAKLRANDTIYIEEASSEAITHKGIYVDIFPYDAYPTDKLKQLKQGANYYFLRRVILAKCKYKPWSMDNSLFVVAIKRLVYIPVKLIAGFCPKKTWIKKYISKCTKYNGTNTGFVYEQAGAAHYGKWVIPEECFRELIPMEFEDSQFLCPKEYDLYLKTVYGDYMILPPKGQRENRHKIKVVSFNVQKE